MLRDILNRKIIITKNINPVVKTFIISESFFWTSWSLFSPIFAIFATNQISGGNIQIAASAFSIYFIFRIISELLTSRLSSRLGDSEKISLVLLGIFLVSISYIGFAFTTTIFPLYLFWIVCGWGFGIASPPKLSLFSMHLDKNKETVEWGITDSVDLGLMALATMAGGFIANQYGFKPLFILAAIINFLAAIPFILYKRSSES